MIAVYKDVYYPMVCGYDVAHHSGIGSYFTIIELQDALSLGMKKMDLLEGSYGWKNRYFTPLPMYKYQR